MKLRNCLFVVFLLCSIACAAQPVWSPGKRAEMETQWMQDSLHLTPAQLQKVRPALLTYQQQMDKATASTEKQHELMQQKDKALKAVLDKQQYKKYYRREKQIRALPKRAHTGIHQAY